MPTPDAAGALAPLTDRIDGVAAWAVDGDGGVGRLGEGFADLWGASPSDRTGLLDCVHPEDRDAVATLFESETQESVVHRVRHPDGGRRWVESIVVPRDGAGVAGLSIDVTERRRRERELAILNRVLRHDVRNDASVILGRLDEVANHDDGEHAALDGARRAAEHVVELTAAAGEYAADGDADECEAHLESLLEREVGVAREAYPDAEFEVETLPDATVAGNRLLASAFRNALHNAVQHNDAATPRVTVTGDATPSTVCVRVTDNGPGISDAVRGRLFEDGARGPDSTGTGMGLSLGREVVSDLGGRVRVEGGESGGTTVCIELPRCD
ncbi:MAG: ATP-binding protein [Halobacteriaceae archaeon]